MSYRLAFSFVALIFVLSTARGQSTASYDSLVQEGNRQLQTGNSAEALASGNRAIALDHGRWQAYALSGGALMNLKRYEEAADSFSKAIELAPVAKQASLRDLRRQCAVAQSNASATTLPSATSASVQPTTTQAEVVLWKSIENSQSKSDFEGYLQQYPKGAFITLAKQHIDELNEQTDRAEKQRLQQQQEAAAAAAAQFDKGMQCYDQNRHWDASGRTDSVVSISPSGFTYTRNGIQTISASCSAITWQLEPHYQIMIRMRINEPDSRSPKKLDFKTGCDGRSPAFAASLERYCGSRSDKLW
jgi:tetratricopeptide (TPR) repeat protein